MNIRELYRILEIDQGAPLDEVRQGYKDMVRVWHPDRFNEDPRLRKKAEEKLKEINRAYADLMTVLSSEMHVAPLKGPGSILCWWRKAFAQIALSMSLIGKLLYQNMCHNLDVIKPTHFLQILTKHKKSPDVEDAWRVRQNSEAVNGQTKRTGVDAEPNFRSVFDEVAREKRAGFQRRK